VNLPSAMGVPLGDEEINFQDLSLHLNFPLKNGGNLSFFGIGGSSKNIFEGPRMDSLRVFAKDQLDIAYTSQMAAIGMTFRKTLTENILWKNAIVYSAGDYERNEDEIRLVNNEPLLVCKFSVAISIF